MEELSLLGIGAALFCGIIAFILQISQEQFGKILKYLFICFGMIFILQSFMIGVSYTQYINGTISNADYGSDISSGITISQTLIFFFIAMLIGYVVYVKLIGGANEDG